MSEHEAVEERFAEIAAAAPRCFWLDGGGAREWSGRRSMIGWLDHDAVSMSYDAGAGEVTRHAGGRATVVGSDIFDALRVELEAGEPGDHWVGYFGYAARPDLPATVAPAGATRLPDAVWMRAQHLEFFNHALPRTDQPATPGRVAGTDPVPDAYAAAFAAVVEQLRAGNSYEVNLTHRLGLTSDLDPVAAYRRLRRLNPAPYAGFLQHDVPGHAAWLLSSSPERYAVVSADRWIETKPIKGTTPRGATPADDEQQRTALATEAKYRAENLMIVDLLRNDLSMVCDPGTVSVPALMEVESYQNVHQLVSTVRGRLHSGVDTLGALRALFPAGSMTGAPKLRTMQIIADVESSARQVYSGAFGWICADGRADLGVVIRSLMTAGDGRYLLGTGGGITVRSDCAEEYAEAGWKAARLRSVFDD